MNWSELFNKITATGIKVVIALVILLITFKLANKLSKVIENKLLVSGKADKTLSMTIVKICRIGLKVLILASIVGYLGIDTSAISALVASLGVCVGLAVNGTLSNFAGGVLLLITRPFKVDDFIEAAGFTGTVEEIRIVTTALRTLDNKIVYIPNGTLSSASIVNYSAKDTRRVDIDFAISYQSDFKKAEALVLAICKAHELTLKDPEPFARVSKHADSSVVITTRVWTKSEDYWTVYFDLMENVKQSFEANGIEIPFTQMDVHVKQ